MFGFEKKKPTVIEFDLEKDLKKHEKTRKEMLKTCDEKTNELKKLLREGTSSQESLDQCGLLLHGYSAINKLVHTLENVK